MQRLNEKDYIFCRPLLDISLSFMEINDNKILHGDLVAIAVDSYLVKVVMCAVIPLFEYSQIPISLATCL